ncbi:peptidase [Streptomyces canus]|uniref:peptidase n=1 Tax=Streptomyces canus TaxID=58343 RepID=UPI0033DAB927
MNKTQSLYGGTRRQLSDLGLPESDIEPADSILTFPDGGHFRIEVPTVNSADAASRLLAESRRRGFTINRITETFGMFRHTADEVRRYVELGSEYGAEILMSVGPRAPYDIGGGVQTPEGMRIGYRLRGQEQVVRAVEDVKRGIDLGVRRFVVYDEGLLWVLSRLRTAGQLPADIHLKVSAHCGHGNCASAQMLEMLGANSFNPVRDLTLPMIGAIRAAISIPIDVHVDNPKLSGGFVRTFDAPEFVRVAAPVYLKTGNSALEGHGLKPTVEQIDDILAQVEIVSEFLDKYRPQACQSPAVKSVVNGHRY